MKIIDLETWLPGPGDPPAGSAPLGPPGPDRTPPLPGYGFANYGTIFSHREDETSVDRPTPAPYTERADQLVKDMDEAGVVTGVLSTAPNDAIVEIVHRHPDRFIGFVNLDPHDGMRAVRKYEELVREQGIRGMCVYSLYTQLPASDRRYYPLYTKCVELDTPVRVYTAMTYANDRPYELGHPRHLDQVCVDFPELKVIAGLGGWPWAGEAVALARRHPNLYIDTAAHRPKYYGVAGSGWEQLLQFGNTLLQDKIMVGLSARVLGMSHKDVIDEYLNLPLKDSVKEKWLYHNAARFFGLE